MHLFIGTGQFIGLHKNNGHGSHGFPVVFGEIFFLGCITSVVPGNIQGHLYMQGLKHGVQHGCILGAGWISDKFSLIAW